MLRAARRLALIAALLLAAAAAAAATAPPALADPTTPPPKPSSLAPHHTAKRSFGAPIQPQILHKRHPKKPSHAEPALHSTPLPDSPK
ncbi:MAG: hypothetical protein ACLPTM_06910 [Steroidobacteraceae bacterium]